ncbi:hypothetical protein O3M35_001483 [Rhynocoris fuscipes]|uniref:Probable RNA-binding protein EIF1AD n=1 Tax=Rhynocoris fuscipes TaxID=488301 RepID=A0AAW1CP34_9HEMI
MSVTTKRKHVTREQICGDFSPPADDELIVRILEGKGHNLHLVSDSKGDEFLVTMPSKFRRAIWVKKGDYLIVKRITEGVKVKAEITKILDNDYIKYLKDLGKWPEAFLKKDEDCDLFDGGNPNKRGEPEGASHSESSSDESD